MLQSAKRINISSKTFQNYNGYMLAPVIDLNGLILSAEQPIAPAIKAFIESKGGKINRVKINGELLVRLTGEFNITRQEVADLIIELTTTGNVLPTTAENQPILPQFAAMIDREMQAEKAKGSPLIFSNGNYEVRLQRSINETRGNTTISAGATIKNEIHAGFSGKDTHYTATSISMRGGKFDGHFNNACVGYMGVLYARQNISLSSAHSTDIENQLVSSMELLSLQGGENGNLKLTMDRSVEWLNNPYPEQFSDALEHTPGKVRLT